MDIFQACREGNLTKVIELIESGADVNAKDNEGKTALIYASEERKKEICEICEVLIANGADVNAKDNKGETVLMIASLYASCCEYDASYYEYKEFYKHICKLLIEKGANVNAKNNEGKTALMYALMYALFGGSKEICELLIKNGADVNAKDINNITPLMIVSTKVFGEICEICEVLIANGADVNAKDNKGKTALIYGARYGKLKICKLLIKKGADIIDLPLAKTEDFKISWDYIKYYKQEFDKSKIISRTKLIKEELMAYVWNPEREYTKWALLDELATPCGGAGF